MDPRTDRSCGWQGAAAECFEREPMNPSTIAARGVLDQIEAGFQEKIDRMPFGNLVAFTEALRLAPRECLKAATEDDVLCETFAAIVRLAFHQQMQRRLEEQEALR